MSLPSSSSGSNEKQQVDDDDDDDEFYDADPLPIIGRCKALYPFEGRDEFQSTRKIRFFWARTLYIPLDIIALKLSFG